MNELVPSSCVVETPLPLAKGIVQAVWRDRVKWLDPCVGAGVFARAIQDKEIDADIDCCDIAPQTIPGAHFFEGDFLSLGRKLRTYDVIVANPPYVPVFRLSKCLQRKAVQETGFDLTVGGASSYWLPFLIRCLKHLNNGGNLAFVLPAAYEYADYARDVRDGIAKLFRHFEVHRSLRPLFETVSDGCIVVLGFGFGENHRTEIWYEHASSDELLSHLDGSAVATVSRSKAETGDGNSTLASILNIGIGAVTGDSNYFLMSDEERAERCIALEDCLTVFTRAKQVARGALLGLHEWEPKDRRLLFKPRETGTMSPGAAKYLEQGYRGTCKLDGQKISGREPWWEVPIPIEIDGVVTGMFAVTPWVAPVSKGVSCTNTLYWIKFKANTSAAQKRACMLSMYTSKFYNAVLTSARRYPDGLLKLEPSQFRKLPLVPLDESLTTRALLKRVASSLLEGKYALARELADRCEIPTTPSNEVECEQQHKDK